MRFDICPGFRVGTAVAALMTALLAGCAVVQDAGGSSGAIPGGSGADTLDGTAWVVSRLHGAAPEKPAAPAPTMRFEYARVAGSDGCNRYSAGYSSQGDAFELVGNMVVTKRACPDAHTRTARAFTAALHRARALRHEAGELLLLDERGKPVMRLAPQAQQLAGTRWRVTGYNNGRQGVESVIGGTALTMEFGTDGRITGSAGCNSYSAGYRREGDKLSISAAVATRRACAEPEGVMTQEARFLDALAMVDRARIEGDQLELRSASGELAVSLEQVADR